MLLFLHIMFYFSNYLVLLVYMLGLRVLLMILREEVLLFILKALKVASLKGLYLQDLAGGKLNDRKARPYKYTLLYCFI